MARPDHEDIAMCIAGALCETDHATGPAYRTIGAAARRVICNLVGQHYYNDYPRVHDMADALGQRYGEWANATLAGECALALSMYKEKYPEG